MIREGTKVKWKWGDGIAQGTVVETFKEKVTKNLQGTKVTRDGTKGNKALFIEQQDGTKVLKLESEVQRN